MRVILALLVASIAAIAAWIIPAWAQTTFPGPVLTQTTLTTAAATIITANPTRRSIRICNVGSTTAITIWPGSLTPPKTDEILAPVTSNVTTCYTPPNGIVTSAGAQWNAIINGGTAGSVSVEEW